MKNFILIIAITLAAVQSHAASFDGYCNTLVNIQRTSPDWSLGYSLIENTLKANGYALIRDADGRGSDFKQIKVGTFVDPAAALNAGTHSCSLQRAQIKQALLNLGGRAPSTVVVSNCVYVYEGATNIRAICLPSETFKVP